MESTREGENEQMEKNMKENKNDSTLHIYFLHFILILDKDQKARKRIGF